jgi:predicted nucleotidyltransferase
MRLQENEREIIISTISEFAPDIRTYLFGSRTDDSKRGGDIDLLLIGQGLDQYLIRKLKILLKEKLGDQKIDIVYEEPDSRTNFGKIIELDAVSL